MKILHTGDIHLGAYVGPQCDNPYKRMENTMGCLDKLVETARSEQPDIILIAGDILHQARVWAERSMVEVRVAAQYLNDLSGIAPTFVLAGTPNHDGIEQLKTIDLMTEVNVRFIFEPVILRTKTASGPIQVAGLPGFDKGHFRAQFPGLSAEEENKIFSEQLAQIVQGLSTQLDPNIPSVLMAHHTVVGCELDNGQHVFQANEVVLPVSALDNSNFDLVCLGHIHKAQRVEACNKPVYYAGSIDAFTFNDEDVLKGFFIHTLDDNKSHSEVFIPTPAREFITERWSQEECQRSVSMNFDIMGFEDKVVRIFYTCDSETEKALDKKKLERDLYAAGAYYVSEIRPEKIEASVNRERMHEKLTVSECLERYLKEKRKTEAEISTIMGEAVDIIAEASANSPAGNNSGMFLPVEISVKNYRSYAEETFSFEDIFFAMVNGKNGSGKSSLFMDAITDCLYERTRENELTGWIRNGEKSGSISFIFRLGNDTYRVTRTRQRSGKATLALAIKNAMAEAIDNFLEECEYKTENKGWQNISCERMADTQQKIIDLLGMDCDTFQSCVLIMQDQYGKFMEADKETRMAVLANLLGLGIYDDLLKLAKEKLADVNREVRAQKADIEALESEITGEEDLHTELQQAEAELRTAQDDLRESKEQLSTVQSKLGAIAGYEEEIGRLQSDLKNNIESYNAKKAKCDDLQQRVEETQSFLRNEQSILDKCAELDKARLDIAALDGKVRLLNDKKTRRFKLDQELMRMRQVRQNIMTRLHNIQESLKERENLEALIAGNDVERDLEECEKKAQCTREFDANIQEQKMKIQMYSSSTAGELSRMHSKLDSLRRQAEPLGDSGCIDIEKARCKFLAMAKMAQEEIGTLKADIEQYIKERREEEARLKNKLELLTEEKNAVGYDPELHNLLIQEVKKYREAKDRLARMAADAATADELQKQDAESLGRIGDIEKELQELDAEIVALESETGIIDALREKVAGLAAYEKMKEQLPKAKQFVESTEGSIAQLSSDLEELARKCKAINDRLNELSLLTIDKGSLYAKKRDIEVQSMNLEAIISKLNQRIGTINAELKSIAGKKEQLKEKQEQLQQSAKQSATLEILSQAFSQDGIPYQIIRDIVPELEAAANEILFQMTGGRMRLEFVTERVLKSNKAKEVATLDVIINDVDHGVLPYLSRSGGQKVRAALAVSFALAMVKASRVGLQLGMMFVDEPPFLDAEGAEAYCMALAAIHERYPEMRILAISHDENMKAMFPQQLYIEITGNGSKVRRL